MEIIHKNHAGNPVDLESEIQKAQAKTNRLLDDKDCLRLHLGWLAKLKAMRSPRAIREIEAEKGLFQ